MTQSGLGLAKTTTPESLGVSRKKTIGLSSEGGAKVPECTAAGGAKQSQIPFLTAPAAQGRKRGIEQLDSVKSVKGKAHRGRAVL